MRRLQLTRHAPSVYLSTATGYAIGSKEGEWESSEGRGGALSGPSSPPSAELRGYAPSSRSCVASAQQRSDPVRAVMRASRFRCTVLWPSCASGWQGEADWDRRRTNAHRVRVGAEMALLFYHNLCLTGHY